MSPRSVLTVAVSSVIFAASIIPAAARGGVISSQDAAWSERSMRIFTTEIFPSIT
jgi:hypothetical protein